MLFTFYYVLVRNDEIKDVQSINQYICTEIPFQNVRVSLTDSKSGNVKY